MKINQCQRCEMRRSDIKLSEDLLDALCADRLVLAFQPIILFRYPNYSDYLYSEVLLRRTDRPLAGNKIESCADGIAALERRGRITQLDFSVLWTVIKLLKRYPDQRLGCNLSAASLRDRSDWCALLSYLTVNSKIAQRLTLEITETSAITQGETELALTTALRACGTRIAIDDLGSGFTTLEFLARCRPDVVKIDRSVLLRACLPEAPVDLLGNLVKVCADYSPCIVVEGVETARDLEVVVRSRAQAFQGFLNHPPTLEPAWLNESPIIVRDFEF